MCVCMCVCHISLIVHVANIYKCSFTSTMPVPAVVGVSVLWVSSNHRRKNIATRMMDCVRWVSYEMDTE